MSIHPTAIIDPQAELGPEVTVGPYALIEKEVEIGEGCVIGPHAVIHSGTSLGPRCELSAGTVLGGAPQDAKYAGERTLLRLGSANLLREYVTLHRASGEGEATVIGDDNLFMAYSHVGHNSVVGNGVLVANCGAIGGHCVVEDFVNIGGLCGIHQFVTIGTMAMVGGLTRVARDIPPYTVWQGNPAEPHGINLRGLQRHEVPEETRDALRRAYRLLFRGELNVSEAIERILEREAQRPAELQRLIDFMRRVEQGHRGRQHNP